MRRRSRTYVATPPGVTIKELLEDRGMSQKEFAARMGLSQKHVSKLIHGAVQLTPQMAVNLEMVLGAPAKFWINLEAIYREKLIKVKAENEEDEDEEIARRFPYSEMAELGWVVPTRKTSEKVVALRKFFEVTRLSLLENEQITRIACRKLRTTEKKDLVLLAWSQEAKLKTRDLSVSPFNEKKLTESLPEIRKLTSINRDEYLPLLEKCLGECGAVLAFLGPLSGLKEQSAALMDGNKVVLVFREGEMDDNQFRHYLFHELVHVCSGHIGLMDGTSEEDERAATQWAEEILNFEENS